MTTPTTPACPDCGGTLTIEPDAEAGVTLFCPNPGGVPYLDHRRRPATVVFCSGCEFAIELIGGRR